GDQESGHDEKDVHADETAGQAGHPRMEEDNGEHSERP
ncbi:MAG: hypothetical protein QOI39_4042, partial [Mycobacterium sp.]|nr:hypothetical protein [Mycobacterium sp.]